MTIAKKIAKWFNAKSLQVKYTLGLLTVSALVLLISGVSYITLLYAATSDIYLSAVRSSAHSIVSNVGPSVMFGDKKTAEEILSASIQYHPFIRGGCIITPQLENFSEYFKTTQNIPGCLELYQHSKGKFKRSTLVTRLDPDDDLGVLLIYSDLSHLGDTLLIYVSTSVIIFFISIFISFLLSYRIKRLFIHPIDKLIHFVRHIVEKGEYKGKIRKTNDDEIGVLTDEFNHMIRLIRMRESALQKHQDELEQVVAERTDELNKSKLAAEKASRYKSEFLANMSHEIRTPMNAILGFAQILAKREHNPEDQRYLDIILSNGKTLLMLINEVLDLSKIEAGKMEINYKAESLESVIYEMHSTFAQKVSDDLELIIRVEELPHTLWIDSYRIRQVLINLISNALKFTDSGYVKVLCKPLRSNGEYMDIILSVEDSGIGIPQEAADVIFESFSQAPEQDANRYGGTGLGLAITRRILHLMNGDISFTSEPGKGSTFTIVLHSVQVGEKDEGGEKTKKENALSQYQWSGQKILIVDDIQDNREILKIELGDVDLRLMEAVNGAEAIDMAIQEKPDLIFMDIKMPVMDGREAIAKLSADERTKDIPIVVLTASLLESEAGEIRKISKGFLRKPFELQDLCSILVNTFHPPKTKTSQKGGSSQDEAAKLKHTPQELFDYFSTKVEPVIELMKMEYDLITLKKMIAALEKEVNITDTPFHTWLEKIKVGIRSFDNEAIDKALGDFSTPMEQLENECSS